MTDGLLTESSGNVRIVAATPAMLDAEDKDAAALARLLHVPAPPGWPPQFNGPKTRAWMRRLLTDHPEETGYGSWYIIADGRLVGICGFKGPPGDAGCVEIGYSVLETEQRKGFASAAVALLVARAFRDARVKSVSAETLPSLVASQRVLERCGFSIASTRTDPQLGEILRFLRRPD